MNGRDTTISYQNMLIIPSVPINDHFKNISVTYTTSSPMEGQLMYFDLDLGYMIKDTYLLNQHQFYVNTSHERIDGNLYKVTLNFLNIGMDFVDY